MKILELCHFSKGICGVFTRVIEEASRLKKHGHNVVIFSSNITKGTNEIAKSEDEVLGVKIKRFPSRKLGGESFMKWDFEKEALKFKPDIIICHSYRHIHTTKALQIKKKINCKVFLVTHAPFDRNSSRSLIQNIIVKFYDNHIGSKILKEFDKVIAITKWEIPFLIKLKLKENNIEYIPNGIPSKFFN